MRRPFPTWVLPVLLAVVAASPLFADEVIYFTNGTTMSVRSHTVEGNMITVELASNASLSFPLRVIERLEVGGHAVALEPSAPHANQAVKGERGVATPGPVTGAATMPARYRRQKNERTRAARSGNVGLPGAVRYGSGGRSEPDVVHPYSNAVNPGRRKVGLVGNQSFYGRSGAATDTPTGKVLPRSIRSRARRHAIRLAPKRGTASRTTPGA